MKYHYFSVCLMVSLLSAAALSCSSHCTCVGNLANCKRVSSLQEVLTDLPRTVEMILLQGGLITMIEPRTFRNFPSLSYLSITDFKMSILRHAFTVSTNGTSRLGVLDLSNNQLESCDVEKLAFTGLQNLTELKLSRNLLSMLKPPWFSDLSSLLTLHIAFNKLSYLPPHIFMALSQLNRLNLSSNIIQYISTDTFYGLDTLSQLDLSNNELLFIDKEAFEPLQRLSHLLLNNNHLVALVKLPGPVQNLHLSSNSWECSCHLVLLLESRSQSIQDPENLLCRSPDNVRGKPILDLGSGYCSHTSPLPATTLLIVTAPASQLTPTLSAQAVIYGFIGGLSLVVAICMIHCCWKYRAKRMLRDLTLHTNEARRREGMKRQSESPKEFSTSKLDSASVIASPRIVNELWDIKEHQKGKGEQHLKISTASCRMMPDSLCAADVPHLQNKGIERDMKHGKAGTWGKAETVTLKHCEIEQRVQSTSFLTDLYKSQHCLCDEGPSNQVIVRKPQLSDTNPPLGNLLSVSTNTSQSLNSASSEVPGPQTEDKDSPRVNGPSSILCGEARSSQMKLETGNLMKFWNVESQDLKAEIVEGSESKAFHRDQNEMVEEMMEEECCPVQMTQVEESSSVVHASTGEMSGKTLWDPINLIGPKAGTHGKATDRYSNVTAIYIGKQHNATLVSGNGDTQLPDVEGQTYTRPILSPAGNSFATRKLKLVNRKSINPQTMNASICGIRHGTKKRIQEDRTCSRALALINVRPGPNTISTSVEEWRSMKKEIVSETSGHLQTRGEIECSSQSKPKCKAQNLIRGGAPGKVNRLMEGETAPKSPRSQNKDKEDNMLELLEVNEGIDGKYSEWRQTSSGNIQLSSNIGLQTSNCLLVSRVAFSETSHQQASLCDCYHEQLGFHLSCKSILQQSREHHSETCQFTNGHKLVASVESDVFDSIDGKENTLLEVPGTGISPADIGETTDEEWGKAEPISPVTQNPVTDISETRVCKDAAFMEEAHQSNGNTFARSHVATKETNGLMGSSANGEIAVSVITEDEISQAGTASTFFSWPSACSVQSQEHWSQSTTTLESALGSEHSEANLTSEVTSKDGEPGHWMVHRENNVDANSPLCPPSQCKTTSFQNVNSRGSASISKKFALELERPIQSPVMAYKDMFSGQEDAAIRRDSRLNMGPCDQKPNHSKNIYKTVFNIMDEMQPQAPSVKVQRKVLQNIAELGVQIDGAKLQMADGLIPLSPRESVDSFQQFEPAGSALEKDYPDSVNSGWFWNRFAERIPTAASEEDNLNTSLKVQCERTNNGPSQTEAEVPVDVRVPADAHTPPELVQWNAPTREELLTDDELMLINMLYTLQKTLGFE